MRGFRYWSFFDLYLIAKDRLIARFSKDLKKRNQAVIRLHWAALRDSALRKEIAEHRKTQNALGKALRRVRYLEDSRDKIKALALDITKLS